MCHPPALTVAPQVNDAYVHCLVQLHSKIEFVASDPKARTHATRLCAPGQSD